MAVTDLRHGKWRIYFDPPPIPIRTCDWHFAHEDFDASWEGEEAGFVGNGLCGDAESIEACKSQIDQIEMEQGMGRTEPRCAECDMPDDNLSDEGVCRECEEFSAPSDAELRRSERTW